MSIENNKLKQLRALKKNNDKSLQYLINEAYRILGNPIILYDIDCKILAYPEDAVTDDPIWNNHINGKMDNNIAIYISEGFDIITTRSDRVVFLHSENLKYNRFFGKIYDKDDLPVACISVVASDKPFEDDDLMAIKTICKMLSSEICKIPFYQNFTQIKIETYINMLIDGVIEETKVKFYISGYIEMIYKGLKDNLYLAVADVSQCDPTYVKLDYYRDLFKRTRPAFKYSIYSNYIVIIMSDEEKIFYPKRVFNHLNRIIEQDNIKVWVSSRFENLFELKQYYTEAVNALDNGLKSNNNQWIFLA